MSYLIQIHWAACWHLQLYKYLQSEYLYKINLETLTYSSAIAEILREEKKKKENHQKPHVSFLKSTLDNPVPFQTFQVFSSPEYKLWFPQRLQEHASSNIYSLSRSLAFSVC